jgi:hypothetical protein
MGTRIERRPLETLRMQAGQHPDAIDTRLVLRISRRGTV